MYIILSVYSILEYLVFMSMRHPQQQHNIYHWGVSVSVGVNSTENREHSGSSSQLRICFVSVGPKTEVE